MNLKFHTLAAIVLLSGFWNVARAEVGFHPDWKSALKPKGAPGAELTLAADGRTDYVIVVPVSPSAQDEKAAGELSQWLGEVTGAEFRVVAESETLATAKYISVGRTELLRQANLPAAGEDLGDEGYAIAVRGDDLFLLGGKKRGPIYAVFALLEEDIGCRWYTRGTSTIPQLRRLTVRPVPRSFVPVLRIRDPFYWDAFDGTWSLRNRTNAPNAGIPEKWGGHVNYAAGWFVHTFDRIISAKDYFDEHPEYFSEIDGERRPLIPGHRPGQLCLTNPDAVRITIDKALGVLDGHPNAELISVSQNDGGGGYCRCAACSAVNQVEGSPAGTLVRFVNQVAEAVEKKRPDVRISTLAYQETFTPPKQTRPRENVVIRLCTDTHAWGNPFLFVTETDKFQNALKGWSDMGAHINIWDYTTSFGAYLTPWPNMKVVADNIRHYIQHNAVGIMLQGAYQSPGGHRARMRSWVWAKQLWDPSLDTRTLMRDFTYGYFGTAAEPIEQYNDLLWRTWQEHHNGPAQGRGNPIDEQIIKEGMRLFERAEDLATEPETRARVKREKLSVLYAKLELGPVGSKDVEDYLKLVDEFESIARQNHVTHLRERPRGIDQHLLRWRSRAGRARVRIEVPGTVDADDIEPRLATHLGEHSAEVVEDPLAENGFAIRQPGGNTQWSIQWVVPVKKLDKGRKYRLRVRVRVDKSGNEGPAFHAGVYNAPNRTYPVGTKGFSAAQVASEEYRWFVIGEFAPQDGDFVYIAPDDNEQDVTAVYTDRIELVPIE